MSLTASATPTRWADPVPEPYPAGLLRRAGRRPDRAPHPGSHTDRVYRLLKDEPLPYPSCRALAARLGLTLAEVRGARARVFRYGYLSTPAQPARNQALRRQRGSVWPEIAVFVRLGMRPAEVRLAVQRLSGRALDEAQIATAFGKRTRQGLALRTPEERRQARLESLHDSADGRERRVAAWLEALAGLLLQGSSARWPRTRSEWLELLRTLPQCGGLAEATSSLDELLRLHEVHRRPLLPSLAEDLAGEIAFLQRARANAALEADTALLCRVLTADQMPTSAFDRDYLVSVCRYLEEYRRTGQPSWRYDPTLCERLDDTVRDRLASQVRVIRAWYGQRTG